MGKDPMSIGNIEAKRACLNGSSIWENPILFSECETPEIPAYLLPQIFDDFATALAVATETPEALSVMTILGVISTVISKHFFICPKDGWLEPINIYTAIALPPANNKSLVLNNCLKPLLDWEKEQKALLEIAIKRKNSELKTQDKIIENLRTKAAKQTDPIEQQLLIAKITQMEMALAPIPTPPVLFTNDATPESLAALVHQQNGRLAIFSDEGGIVETLSGLYTKGNANIDILLKGIDGGDVRVQRKDRSFSINPYLTIVLTIQPGVLQGMGEKRVFLGNGALERFLYVLPKSKLGYRTHDKPSIPSIIQESYYNKILSLLNSFCLPEQNQHVQPYHLKLEPLAYQAWRDFQSNIESQLRPDGKLSLCQGWGGKICGFSLRIAGLLHVAEYAPTNLIISKTTMQNALQIASLLTDHALATFGMMGADQVTQDAKQIFYWIKARDVLSFTQSELVLAMRNKTLGKAERLNKAIHVLRERNIISSPIKLSTRKPTTMYRVNPMVISTYT
jgi:hypothetical protein